MATYLILNLVVLAALTAVMLVHPARLSRKRLAIVLIILLVMTAVFDSLIIHFGIVAYTPAKILGVYIGQAPIEDFSYAIAAAVLVPYLWERFGRHEK